MSRKHSMRIVTISLLVALLLVAPVASADGPPELPNTIKGGIMVNDNDAPAGTLLAAYDEQDNDEQDNMIGYAEITVPGQYVLPISKPIGSIDIYFQTPEMPDAAKTSNTLENWVSGAVTNLDLTGIYTAGSSSSGKNLRGMSTKSSTSANAGSGEAIAGGGSNDAGEKGKTVLSSEASELSAPPKESSSSTMTFLIVGLIGILAVAALFYAIYKKQNP